MFWEANMLYFLWPKNQEPCQNSVPIKSFQNRQTLEQFFEPLYLASSSYNQLTNTMRTTMSLSQPTALARAFKIPLNTTFQESTYSHIKFPMQCSYTKYLGDKKKASTVFDPKNCGSTNASLIAVSLSFNCWANEVVTNLLRTQWEHVYWLHWIWRWHYSWWWHSKKYPGAHSSSNHWNEEPVSLWRAFCWLGTGWHHIEQVFCEGVVVCEVPIPFQRACKAVTIGKFFTLPPILSEDHIPSENQVTSKAPGCLHSKATAKFKVKVKKALDNGVKIKPSELEAQILPFLLGENISDNDNNIYMPIPILQPAAATASKRKALTALAAWETSSKRGPSPIVYDLTGSGNEEMQVRLHYNFTLSLLSYMLYLLLSFSHNSNVSTVLLVPIITPRPVPHAPLVPVQVKTILVSHELLQLEKHFQYSWHYYGDATPRFHPSHCQAFVTTLSHPQLNNLGFCFSDWYSYCSYTSPTSSQKSNSGGKDTSNEHYAAFGNFSCQPIVNLWSQ